MIQAAVLGGIVSTVSNIIDDLHTSDEEKLQAHLEARRLGIEEAKIDAGLLAGQVEVNKVEAQHQSIFVAGWRPAVGWAGVAGLVYQYVAYPLLTWGWALMQARQWVPAELQPPPLLDTEALIVLLTAILGIGTARTFEKIKGVAK